VGCTEKGITRQETVRLLTNILGFPSFPNFTVTILLLRGDSEIKQERRKKKWQEQIIGRKKKAT